MATKSLTFYVVNTPDGYLFCSSRAELDEALYCGEVESDDLVMECKFKATHKVQEPQIVKIK